MPPLHHGDAQRSQHLARLTQEYESLRRRLPPEEFAPLPPPDKQLEKICRPEYLKNRAAAAPKEWATTLVELLSGGGLLASLLIPPRRSERSTGDAG